MGFSLLVSDFSQIVNGQRGGKPGRSVCLHGTKNIKKMDDVWTLLLLSFAMLVGCYLAGIIPLAINLSEVKQ